MRVGKYQNRHPWEHGGDLTFTEQVANDLI